MKYIFDKWKFPGQGATRVVRSEPWGLETLHFGLDWRILLQGTAAPYSWCKGIRVPRGLRTVEKFPKISPRNFVFRIWRRSSPRSAPHCAEQIILNKMNMSRPPAKGSEF